ncbi:MAG: MarR family winged helix-turn-helix transcriptional regulator [Chloroflexota bacterium]
MARYDTKRLDQEDYRVLAQFRLRIRQYLHFSEKAARDAGLEPQQYQLLLALKGMPAGAVPSVGELAERLVIEHHSAVGLIDRLEARGIVHRQRDPSDGRRIILTITALGEKTIGELAAYHRGELRKSAPELIEALSKILGTKAGP